MKGDLSIQIFVNVSNGLTLSGVSTQQVTVEGTATFESIGEKLYFIRLLTQRQRFQDYQKGTTT